MSLINEALKRAEAESSLMGRGLLSHAVRKAEKALAALQNEVLLSHPLLDFDKLLFLKSPGGYGHTYTDQNRGGKAGSLCVLSPVSPDGKVTDLVPELKGGQFDRFDLSFDGTRVIFGYQKDKNYRIYEVDINFRDVTERMEALKKKSAGA